MINRCKHILTRSLACSLFAAALTGCSGNNTSSSADKERIAALEAEVKELKAAAVAAPSPEKDVKIAEAEPTPVPEPLPAPEEEVGKQWDYTITEEKMTGGKTKFASVSSANTVEFDFPYSGAQHGTLTLRTDPRHGKDVMFQIQRGQILCPSYQGCSVQIRFDDNKPVTYRANGPADNSSETIFIEGYTGFINKLKNAKRVRLSVNIYQQGSPVFEFDVSGFNLSKYQGKS